jgi:ribosome-binding protein aMBF1 (putative translation factor)
VVVVRVRATDNPVNQGFLRMQFIDREPRRPYYQHIDRQLLREQREKLRMSQEEVGRKLGKYQVFVSNIETGKSNPTDEVLAQMARIYGQPLSSFLKKQ